MFAPPILACPEAESAWEGATNLWNYLDFMIIRNKKNQKYYSPQIRFISNCYQISAFPIACICSAMSLHMIKREQSYARPQAYICAQWVIRAHAIYVGHRKNYIRHRKSYVGHRNF